MTTKAIFFDMDGTIADLYGVDNWLPKLLAKDVTPYMDAQPLGDMRALDHKLSMLTTLGYTIGVVSWCAKNAPDDAKANRAYDAQVRKAKRAWLEEHLPSVTKIHVVKHGTDKSRAIRLAANEMEKCVLFDDELNNCQAWQRHTNYEAVHVTRFDDIIHWVDTELKKVG